jgi:hypothetical protein
MSGETKIKNCPYVQIAGTVSADICDDIYATDERVIEGKTTVSVDKKNIKIGNDFFIINDGVVDLKVQFNNTASDIQTIKPSEVFRDEFFKFSDVYISNNASTAGEYRLRINGV